MILQFLFSVTIFSTNRRVLIFILYNTSKNRPLALDGASFVKTLFYFEIQTKSEPIWKIVEIYFIEH